MTNKLSTFEKEQAECAKKINDYKLSSEANIVASIFKNPDLLYNIDLKLEDFSNNIWRCWFAVADGLVLKEKKPSLDEISVGIYLEKHLKLKEKIEEYGGYSTIQDATSYINLDNFDSYVNDVKKFNILLKLLKYGFPVSENLSSYIDKTSSEIYEELELLLNHTFLNAESNVKSYNAFDNIFEYVNELNEGADIGLPLYGADILNAEIGGMHKGNIIGLGASSGCGKSYLAFNYLVPSCIQYNEPVVFIINEEDHKRFQKELLVWVANNIYGTELNKYTLRNGHFSDSVLGTLKQCAKWIEDKKDQHLLTIVPLQTYTVDLAIKVIKKYSSAMGVSYFVLDTMKESANSHDEIYRSMLRDSVKLYDTIKPTNRNVALLITYQLNKASLKMRKLTSNEIGMSKGILDVFSVNIMARKPNADEYEGQPKELKCFRLEGKNKIPFGLKEGKQYLILFITKNRYGKADSYEIVAEVDFGKDYYKEIGYTLILEDF
jgi:replicative DNA helicase